MYKLKSCIFFSFWIALKATSYLCIFDSSVFSHDGFVLQMMRFLSFGSGVLVLGERKMLILRNLLRKAVYCVPGSIGPWPGE